jgi:hypothetical protein
LNNGLSWEELAAKQQGTVRSTYRPPYFSQYELQAGFAYSGEAMRRGQIAQMQRMLEGGPTSYAASSEALSSTPDFDKDVAPAAEDSDDSDARTPVRRTRRAAQPAAEKSEAAVDSSTRP